MASSYTRDLGGDEVQRIFGPPIRIAAARQVDRDDIELIDEERRDVIEPVHGSCSLARPVQQIVAHRGFVAAPALSTEISQRRLLSGEAVRAPCLRGVEWNLYGI